VSERLRAGHERAARTLQTTTDSIDEPAPAAPIKATGTPRP
jgi:2-dehydro-3-deoxygluconokinase